MGRCEKREWDWLGAWLELGRVPEMREEGGGLGSEAASQADGGWRMEHRGRVETSVAWFSVSPLRGGEHPINIDPPGSAE